MPRFRVQVVNRDTGQSSVVPVEARDRDEAIARMMRQGWVIGEVAEETSSWAQARATDGVPSRASSGGEPQPPQTPIDDRGVNRGKGRALSIVFGILGGFVLGIGVTVAVISAVKKAPRAMGPTSDAGLGALPFPARSNYSARYSAAAKYDEVDDTTTWESKDIPLQGVGANHTPIADATLTLRYRYDGSARNTLRRTYRIGGDRRTFACDEVTMEVLVTVHNRQADYSADTHRAVLVVDGKRYEQDAQPDERHDPDRQRADALARAFNTHEPRMAVQILPGSELGGGGAQVIANPGWDLRCLGEVVFAPLSMFLEIGDSADTHIVWAGMRFVLDGEAKAACKEFASQLNPD